MPPPTVLCLDYRDFVRQETANRTQLDVDELVEELGKLGDKEEARTLLLEQAELAKERNHHKWLQRSRDRGVGLAEPTGLTQTYGGEKDQQWSPSQHHAPT